MQIAGWDFISSIGVITTIAGFFTILSVAMSVWLMYKHLINYTQPHLQRYIVRIIMMVPIYAITSFLSLYWIEYSVVFALFRDGYEAYVVYTFFSLLVAFINSYDHLHVGIEGEELQELPDTTDESEVPIDVLEDEKLPEKIEPRITLPTEVQIPIPQADQPEQLDVEEEGAQNLHRMKVVPNSNSLENVIAILETKEKLSHPIPICCLPKITPGRSFLYACKRGVMQFVIIKPIMAITAAILFFTLPSRLTIGVKYPYIYIIAINNISVTLAMYMLVLFYRATKMELKPFKPIPKFLCIKIVILFAFWQGITIALLSWSGILHGNLEMGFSDENAATGLQDFLICIEMFLVSILHFTTFSQKPYRSGQATCDDYACYNAFCCCCCQVGKNLTHVVSQQDVIRDGVDTFAIDKVGGKVVNIGKKAGKIVLSDVPSILSDVPHMLSDSKQEIERHRPLEEVVVEVEIDDDHSVPMRAIPQEPEAVIKRINSSVDITVVRDPEPESPSFDQAVESGFAFDDPIQSSTGFDDWADSVDSNSPHEVSVVEDSNYYHREEEEFIDDHQTNGGAESHLIQHEEQPDEEFSEITIVPSHPQESEWYEPEDSAEELVDIQLEKD